MKKILFSLLFCIVSLATQAQTSREKVLELIEVMQADQMIKQTMDQMLPVMLQQVEASLKTEEEKSKMKQAKVILNEELKTYGQNIVKGPMVAIYSKHFTSQDIDSLIAFYKTETGKKLIKLTPVISAELMQTIMQKEIPELQSRIKKRIKALKSTNS